MITRFLLPVFAVLSLSACTTPEDLRAREPTRSGEFKGAYRPFAECLQFRLGGRVLYDAPNRTAYVGNDPATGLPGQPIAFYEIGVRQSGADEIAVELHQRWGLEASAKRAHYWAAVEACAA